MAHVVVFVDDDDDSCGSELLTFDLDNLIKM